MCSFSHPLVTSEDGEPTGGPILRGPCDGALRTHPIRTHTLPKRHLETMHLVCPRRQWQLVSPTMSPDRSTTLRRTPQRSLIVGAKLFGRSSFNRSISNELPDSVGAVTVNFSTAHNAVRAITVGRISVGWTGLTALETSLRRDVRHHTLPLTPISCPCLCE